MSGAEVAEQVEPIGSVIITWPNPGGPPVPVTNTVLIDADTGKKILTATALVVRSNVADNGVYADLTLICDPDGKPYLDKVGAVRFDADGNVRTGTFRFLVAEMRVAANAGWMPANAKPVEIGEHGPEWPHP